MIVTGFESLSLKDGQIEINGLTGSLCNEKIPAPGDILKNVIQALVREFNKSGIIVLNNGDLLDAHKEDYSLSQKGIINGVTIDFGPTEAQINTSTNKENP